MILKWRWIQVENRCWYSNLIGYSETNKDHIQMLNESLKKLQRKDCIRVIVENGEFKE